MLYESAIFSVFFSPSLTPSLALFLVLILGTFLMGSFNPKLGIFAFWGNGKSYASGFFV